MTGTELPAVSELLWQRGDMILLERLLGHDGESTTARVATGSQHWLRRAGGPLPAWLALEYMAQCVSAHEGMLARAEGRSPPRGLLVAVSGLRFHRWRLGSEPDFRVRASRVGGRPELGALSHACQIHAESTGTEAALLAEGRISVVLSRPCAVTTVDPRL